jgi:hypothetical protein
MDDAGTGYSRHPQLAPDVIKLDMSLTRGFDADPAVRALARAILFYARETGPFVVAEEIDTTGMAPSPSFLLLFVVVFFIALHNLISRSLDAHAGRAPKYLMSRMRASMARCANRRAIFRSRPFPRIKGREMSLYEPDNARSRFPGLSIGHRVAERNGNGCQPLDLHREKYVFTCIPMRGHASRFAARGISSAAGTVFFDPLKALSTSSCVSGGQDVGDGGK